MVPFPDVSMRPKLVGLAGVLLHQQQPAALTFLGQKQVCG